MIQTVEMNTPALRPALRPAPRNGQKKSPPMTEDAFKDFRPIAQRWVMDRLEEFLALNPEWSETALLNAAGMDHRFFARIRAGESFTTQKVFEVFDTANKIMRGEIARDQGKYKRVTPTKSRAAENARVKMDRRRSQKTGKAKNA